jgi:hypothetical protein
MASNRQALTVRRFLDVVTGRVMSTGLPGSKPDNSGGVIPAIAKR